MDEQPAKFIHAAGHADPSVGHPRRARRLAPRPPRAFTLIEILIVVVILGILAAIVVPQFSNASHVARENMLKDDLRYLRTQIAVYKAQHRDAGPGLLPPSLEGSQTTFEKQMTSRTNDRGQWGTTAEYRLGPYLQKIPPNPLTQAAGVLVLPRGVRFPTPDQVTDAMTKEYGWIYRVDTQEIVACSKDRDARSRPYIEY